MRPGGRSGVSWLLAGVLASALLAALGLPAGASGAGADSGRGSLPPAGALARRSGHRIITLTGFEAAGGIDLPDLFAVAGTETVRVSGAALERGSGYLFDTGARRLVLTPAPAGTSRVVVSYSFLPLGLAPVYRRAVPESLAEPPPGVEPGGEALRSVARESPAAASASGLRVGGAKTFGVTVGSDRDLQLEQSLRMNITGTIARDVSVNAYLSDQNTPLVAEGDTEELRALDQVLVEIEAKNVSATMGDYVLSIDGGQLASIRRELSGAEIVARGRGRSLLLAGARSEGRFATTTFRGVEGKQGPYLLIDGGGSTGARVVAGSERVWLDGERLRRGRDNDYTIDYAAGEIEFTEGRPITGESEITVDYESAEGEYRRDIYGGRGEVEVARGRVAVGASFFREADDEGAAVSTALTERQLAILAAAGDDPDLAMDDGVDSVGIGAGDYGYDAGAGYFVYVGENEGEYDLSFERDDAGSYYFDYETGYFAHVDEGGAEGVARYRLGRSLAAPTEHLVAAVDARAEFERGGFASAEAAVSGYDANTLSTIDDDDNLGNAGVVEGRLPAVGLGVFGGAELELGVRARRVAGLFREIGRFRDVRYGERWELEGLDLPVQERLFEGNARLSLPGGGELRIERGLLKRGDALESARTEFSLEGRPTARSRLWANGRLVDLVADAADSTLDRTRRLYRGGAEYTIAALRPGLAYTRDAREEGGRGERYDEYAATIESAWRGESSFSVRFAHRLNDSADGGAWRRVSTTRTQEYRATVRESERFVVEGSLLRRETESEPGAEAAGSRYDLATLRVGHRSFEGRLSGEVRYAITSTEVEEKEKYVTEEDGVEITRIVATGRYLPVTDLSASTSWKVRLGRSGGRPGRPEPTAWARFLSGLTFETEAKMREMSRTSDKTGLYLLHPDVIQGPETVSGRLSTRHVARYVRPNGSLSVRLIVKTRDELDRRYTNAAEVRDEREAGIDLKLSPSGGWTYRLEGEVGTRERVTSGAAEGYEIDSRSLLAEVAARRLGSLELRMTGTVVAEADAVSGADALRWTIGPMATYRFAGRGTAMAAVTRSELSTDAEALPTAISAGRSPGAAVEWRLSGDYRFNRYLTGSVSYVGRRRSDEDDQHTLDVRVNAFF